MENLVELLLEPKVLGFDKFHDKITNFYDKISFPSQSSLSKRVFSHISLENLEGLKPKNE